MCACTYMFIFVYVYTYQHFGSRRRSVKYNPKIIPVDRI